VQASVSGVARVFEFRRWARRIEARWANPDDFLSGVRSNFAHHVDECLFALRIVDDRGHCYGAEPCLPEPEKSVFRMLLKPRSKS